jgi:hypothetical protein
MKAAPTPVPAAPDRVCTVERGQNPASPNPVAGDRP